MHKKHITDEHIGRGRVSSLSPLVKHERRKFSPKNHKEREKHKKLRNPLGIAVDHSYTLNSLSLHHLMAID